MEKLLRILFVMCAIAFVTTLTACADDKTGGNDKPAKTPSIFKFTPEAKGVTIDESKDVYKITINPSLLDYKMLFPNPPVAAFALAPIFILTFTDDNLQGFIIPTTADKAEDLTTTHVADMVDAVIADLVAGIEVDHIHQGAPNGITHSFLATDNRLGFNATELNADWSTLAPRAKVVVGGGKPDIPEFDGIPNIVPDTKVRVMCTTTMTGIKATSFTLIAPADADLAIAKGTKTVCGFSLVGRGTYLQKKAAYKDWATAAVELAKDDSTKNIQKMGFVGIVTGDDTASAITKAAGITEDADALGVKGFTADASAKLVKAYNSVLQKVEIVIAVAK